MAYPSVKRSIARPFPLCGFQAQREIATLHHPSLEQKHLWAPQPVSRTSCKHLQTKTRRHSIGSCTSDANQRKRRCSVQDSLESLRNPHLQLSDLDYLCASYLKCLKILNSLRNNSKQTMSTVMCWAAAGLWMMAALTGTSIASAK